MDNRRDFLKKASLLAGGAGLMNVLPPAIQKALAIDPQPGSTYLDAEHIVFMMQENRSFDHTYGTLQGVRGYNDPRAIRQPDQNLVWMQSDKDGNTYAPFHLDIRNTKATWMKSLPHAWSNQVDANNKGKHDQWLNVKHSGNHDYAEMPLTMGYYTREDIPFYYALADAFTVCDQNFCSSLTGTTPNRLFFWTGTIRKEQNEASYAHVWNEDADDNHEVDWMTYPERLEANGVSWKVYQNEITTDTGFEGEEDPWLSNFGDNPLEYFTQYHAKLSPAHRAVLPKRQQQLEAGIHETEAQAAAITDGSEEKKKTLQKLEQLKKALARNKEAQEMLTQEAYDRIPAREKNLHEKAFTTNRDEPDSRKLVSLKYQDQDTEREVLVPKGDVLYQFREDVTKGTLPAVSWIVAPENFSDHPSAAWYGAWYISEVLDILTKDPEVWKKTIFIITYDENDGYFDHVPPFIAPDPADKTSGFCSAHINTGVEYVNGQAQSQGPHVRENSIGLGFRVPMVIASPWSRGGWVCSEVFDHTSSLQFLEKFIAEKWKKHIPETNISDWRRTICGDMRSAFRPYHGEKIQLPDSVERDEFIEGIHKAKFKNVPDNYHRLMAEDIIQINRQPGISPYMPVQEKGTRPACSLPYELYADCNCGTGNIQVIMKAGNEVFGRNAAGAPFLVYASGLNGQEKMQVRSYAVAVGDELQDKWQINEFTNGRYRLDLYGPNGFYRVFEGNEQDPGLIVNCSYETGSDQKHLTGNVLITLLHKGAQQLPVEITDNSYGENPQHISVGDSATTVIVPVKNSHGWYDISIRVKGRPSWHRRFAGHVETGQASRTDPFMGHML